jgi:hypothetical protein
LIPRYCAIIGVTDGLSYTGGLPPCPASGLSAPGRSSKIAMPPGGFLRLDPVLNQSLTRAAKPNLKCHFPVAMFLFFPHLPRSEQGMNESADCRDPASVE